MKPIAVVTLLMLSTSIVIHAQQKDSQPQVQAFLREPTSGIANVGLTFSKYGLQQPKRATASNHPQIAARQIVDYDRALGRAHFVFVKNSLFVALGDWLVPAPGGGASGCFSADLQERSLKVRQFIQAITSGHKSTAEADYPSFFGFMKIERLR